MSNRLILKQLTWRRGAGSNRRIKVLQTSALPLGYRAGPEEVLFETYHKKVPEAVTRGR